jgi:hypothetical protein
MSPASRGKPGVALFASDYAVFQTHPAITAAVFGLAGSVRSASAGGWYG